MHSCISAFVVAYSLPRHRAVIRRNQLHLGDRCYWGYEDDYNCREQSIVGWSDNVVSSSYAKQMVQYSWVTQDFGQVASLRSSIHEVCIRHGTPATTRSSFKCSKDWRYCRARDIALSRNSFCSLDCTINRPIEDDIAYQQSNTKIFDAFHAAEPAEFQPSLCTRNITQTALLLSPPGHVANLYHFMEHLNAIYVALHVAGLITSRNDIDPTAQISLFASEQIQSRYMPFYECISHSPVQDISRMPADEHICFRDMIFPAVKNPYAMHTIQSRLYMEFSRFVWDRLVAPWKLGSSATATAVGQRVSPKQRKRKMAVLLRVERSGTRRLLNQDRIIDALLERFADSFTIELALFGSACVPSSTPDTDCVLPAQRHLARIRVCGTIREQMGYVRGVQILIGVHGAGLTWLMFMSSSAVLVELRPPRGESNGYISMSSVLGKGIISHQYEGLEYKGVTSNYGSVSTEDCGTESNSLLCDWILPVPELLLHVTLAVQAQEGRLVRNLAVDASSLDAGKGLIKPATDPSSCKPINDAPVEMEGSSSDIRVVWAERDEREATHKVESRSYFCRLPVSLEQQKASWRLLVEYNIAD